MYRSATERGQIYAAAIEQALGAPLPEATDSAGKIEALVRRLPLDVRLAVVQVFAGEINSCTRLSDLTDVVGDSARWIVGCAQASLALLEEGDNRASYRLYINVNEDARNPAASTLRVPLAEGLPGYVVRTSAPVLATDLATDARRSNQVEGEWLAQGLQAANVLPLWWGGQVIGALGFVATEAGHLGPVEQRLAALVAGMVAPAVSSLLLYRQLEALSLHDTLTSLPNRRHLDWRLETDCARAARYGTALSLVLVDIDRFHSINGRCGYQLANQVLQGIAHLLVTGTRRADLVARLEADKLAVVLPETELRAAQAVAEHLRTRIVNARLLAHAPLPCQGQVTISAGVAAYGAETPGPSALILAAQVALDAAKALGGDCVEVALPNL